jgi:heme oxygenase
MNKELQIAGTARPIPLTDLLASIDSLPASDRVALLNHLQTQQNFSTVLEHQLSDFGLWQQINQMSRQQLAEVLKVIAFRISRD